MKPREIKQALSGYIPARILEPALTLAESAAYLAKFGPGVLRANRSLRGGHTGKRCFVLGNGPSLRTQDLGRLRGEQVFTVNSFVAHARELGVTSTCHTVMDPFYFSEPDDKTLRQCAELPADTVVIAPLHYKAIVDRHVKNAKFLLTAGEIEGNTNADLSRPIPAMYSVTNTALLVALYMGFSEIYLLGCEMDMLSRIESVQPLRIREAHYYDDEQPVADWGALGFDYSKYTRAVLRMFDGFRFADRVRAPNQAIYNATPGGLLDVFPRVDFNQIA
jgi:hypothetical protein